MQGFHKNSNSRGVVSMEQLNFQNREEVQLRTFKILDNKSVLLSSQYIDDDFTSKIKRSKLFEKHAVALCVESYPEEDFCIVSKLDGYEDRSFSMRTPAIPVGEHIITKHAKHEWWDCGTVTKETLDYIEEKLNEEFKDELEIAFKLKPLQFNGTITKDAVEEIVSHEYINAQARTTIPPKEKELSPSEKQWLDHGISDKANGVTMNFHNQSITLDTLWRDLVNSNRYSLPYDMNGAITKLQEAEYVGDVTVVSNKGTFKGHIEPRKCTIEGVKVRKQRWYPLMRRLIYGEINKQQLGIYNELSNIRMDLALLDHIDVHRYPENLKIPIQITFITKDKLRVNFLGQDVEMSYDTIKDFLIYGKSIRKHFYGMAVLRLTRQFGFSDQDAFAKLKDIHVLSKI